MSTTPFEYISFHGHTDVGQRRKNNEDDLGLFPETGMFCVADGMGGGDDGEVASSSTVAALSAVAAKCIAPAGFAYPHEGLVRLVKRALSDVSYRIHRRTGELGLKSCGSTFVGVVFDAANPARATALHAGDSRLYLIREGSLRQVTRDHSPAEAVGEKNENQVNPMFKGMILRAVGVAESVDLEETPFEVASGDKILLCSDGLYRMVDEARILKILAASTSPQAAVTALVAAANAAGGVDNITVELIELGELPKPLATAELPEGIYERVRVALPRFEERCQRTMSAPGETARSSTRSSSLSSASSDTCSSRTNSFEDPQFTPEAAEETEELPIDRTEGLFAGRGRLATIGILVVAVAILCATILFLSTRSAAETGEAESHAKLQENESQRLERVKELRTCIQEYCQKGNAKAALKLVQREREKKYLRQDESLEFLDMIQETMDKKGENETHTTDKEDTPPLEKQPEVSSGPDRKNHAFVLIDWSRLEKDVLCSLDRKPVDSSCGEIDLEEGCHNVEWSRPGFKPLKKKSISMA